MCGEERKKRSRPGWASGGIELYNQTAVRADIADRGMEKKNRPGEAARGAPWREESTGKEWTAMGTVDEASCRGKTDILGDASRAWMRPCRGWEPQDGGPSNASSSGGKPHNQKGLHGGAFLLVVFILICRISGRQRRDAKMR